MAKISDIEIQRTPQVGGWRWRAWYSVTTANQFTDEVHQIEGHSRWAWLAIFQAIRAAKREAAALAAKPGERAFKGWAD